MGDLFQIQSFLFILSFIPLISISCDKNTGESRSYKFYYDGSYHVVASPPLDSDDMTPEHCINVEKPSRVLGDLKSSLDTGGECVIIYAQKDCQPPRLEGPSTSSISFDSTLLIDRIRSFHRCTTNSTKELPHPSEIQQAYLKPIDYNVKGDLQLDIKDDCMDLPQNSDKKLSHVGTKRNCLLLYDSKNCQGSSFKLKNVGLNTNLDKVGWDKKVSSVKSCGMYLQARIPAFKLTSKLEDLKLDGKLRDGEIIDSQNFTNNGTQAIVRTYEWPNVFYNDSFTFQSIESLSPFRGIEVKDKIKFEGFDITKVEGDPSLCFPVNSAPRCIPVKRIEDELKHAYHLQAHNTSHDKARNWTATLSRNFSIHENVTIPPCSTLQVRSFMVVRENIRIDFDLGVTIFGENIHGVNMTSSELLNSLPRGLVYLRNLDKRRIYGKTKGKMLASVGVKLKTDIKIVEGAIPGCIKIRPITTSTTSSPTLNSTTTTPREPKAIKDIITGPSNYDAENGAQMDMANFFLLIAIGAVLLCTLFMCLITLCSRRSRRYPSEFELWTMGEYVLTIRCICPRCK